MNICISIFILDHELARLTHDLYDLSLSLKAI